ncbi:MAG: hypothetical protein K2O42_06100 [Oscillospiraceae bacterium]|nr:hypothetical protein [Oscillospiraceae bacterium]
MIDINKSIEELENDYWSEPTFNSYVITTCHKARQKPLKFLSNEEIRCLIGQKIGLRFLLPIAVDILKNDPLIEITYFEGDLLLALLRLDITDWEYNQDERKQLMTIIRSNRSLIEQCEEISSPLIGEI